MRISHALPCDDLGDLRKIWRMRAIARVRPSAHSAFDGSLDVLACLARAFGYTSSVAWATG